MIRAASEGPGKGATFTVDATSAATTDGRRRATAGGGRRRCPSSRISVLLVEDDEDARTLLTQTMEYDGAHVLPVASASEAIQILEQHHADVLLSDLRMPGKDGFELIHSLRSRRDPDVAHNAGRLNHRLSGDRRPSPGHRCGISTTPAETGPPK